MRALVLLSAKFVRVRFTVRRKGGTGEQTGAQTRSKSERRMLRERPRLSYVLAEGGKAGA